MLAAAVQLPAPTGRRLGLGFRRRPRLVRLRGGLRSQLRLVLGPPHAPHPPNQMQADALALALRDDEADVLVVSQTGSGKTLLFVLPMLEQLAASGGRGDGGGLAWRRRGWWWCRRQSWRSRWRPSLHGSPPACPPPRASCWSARRRSWRRHWSGGGCACASRLQIVAIDEVDGRLLRAPPRDA